MSVNLRQQGMSFFQEAQNTSVLQVGAGGIGSWLAFLLVSSGIKGLIIYDDDKVEEHNVGGQFYNLNQKDNYKVNSLRGNILLYSQNSYIKPMVAKWTPVSIKSPIMISCVDNMKTRKEMFEAWVEMEEKELFMDGRLGPQNYEVYTVYPNEESINAYRDTLFDDSELEDLPCTTKATKYMAFGIASAMCSTLMNYLSNKKLGLDACVVPQVEKHYGNIKMTENA